MLFARYNRPDEVRYLPAPLRHYSIACCEPEGHRRQDWDGPGPAGEDPGPDEGVRRPGDDRRLRDADRAPRTDREPRCGGLYRSRPQEAHADGCDLSDPLHD